MWLSRCVQYGVESRKAPLTRFYALRLLVQLLVRCILTRESLSERVKVEVSRERTRGERRKDK